MADNDSVIDDLIRNIYEQPDAADQLVRVISQRIRDTNTAADLRSASHEVQQRWLNNGVPVTNDSTGAGRDVLGQAQFDTVNVIGGAAYVNPTNPRQVDFSAGAGGDCMFDYLVSSCFATLPAFAGFVEGQVFTTLSGCTFKGYSTVAGAATQCATDFPAGTIGVIFICGGTYLEGGISIATSTTQRWIGAGLGRTIIGKTTADGGTPTVLIGSTGATLYLQDLTIRSSSNAGSTAGGVQLNSTAVLWAFSCDFQGGSNTIARAGITLTASSNSQNINLTRCTFSSGCGVDGGASACAVKAERCDFTGAGVGIALSQYGHVDDCYFNIAGGTGITLNNLRDRLHIADCVFNTCTVGISLLQATSNLSNSEFIDNKFYATPTGIDLNNVDGTGAVNNTIARNTFVGATAACILWPSTTRRFQALVYDNQCDSTSVMFSGTQPAAARTYDNLENFRFQGNVRSNGVWGILGIPEFGLVITWPQFYVMFGATRTTVAQGTTTLGGAGTYYASVNTAGTLTIAASGAFPVNEMPLAIITAIGTRVNSVDYYDGIFNWSASGAPGAPADGTFVTTAPVTGLTAGRVLTSGNGVSATVSGADPNKIVTVALAPLTALYDQSGAFNWVNRGGDLLIANSKSLKLYSDNSTTPSSLTGEWRAADGHLGLGQAATDVALMTLIGTITSPASAPTGITVSPSFTYTANDAQGLNAHNVSASINGAFTQSGVVRIFRSAVTMGASAVANDVRGFESLLLLSAGANVVDRYGIRVSEATGTGTVTNQYGVYIAALTKGGTLNYGLYSLAPDRHGNRVEFDGIAAPSTPAADDIVVYNESGTKLFKAKDDAGAVYAMTHTHLVSCVVDGTVTTQYTVVGPMVQAGTIVSSKSKTCDKITIGATSWTGEVYKIPAANVDTDGGGEAGSPTIYSTAPAITNGHMVSTNDVLSVTTFAAGDYFSFRTTQVGTSATMIEMSLKIRYT